MKWIGQHIWDFISRFRSDVYLEGVTESAQDHVVGIDADGKLYKQDAYSGDITGVTAGDGLTGGGTSDAVTLNVGAGTGIDVGADAISVDVSDFMTNGADNYVVTATGTDAMNAESMLKFSGTELDIGSSADHIASLQFTNDVNSFKVGVSNATNGGIIGTADGDVFINSSGDFNICIGQNNTTNLKIDTDGDVVVSNNLDVTGAITGNVTGNASGSSGSCTGNAATATALATARAINGVDFDGTAPITITAAGSTLSDTVTVAKGGTGTTSLAADSILTGNDGNAIVAEAYLTYSTSDEELIIGNPDAGDATISRRDSSGTNTAGGNLIIQAGPATGNAAGGSIKFHSSTAGLSGSTVQTPVEIAALDKDGNLQIDGDLTISGGNITNAVTFDNGLTGSLTGDASGSSGSCTGNAATATTLTSGDKSLSGIYTTKGYKQQDNRNLTVGADGHAIHVDASDMTDASTSASGTNTTYNHVTFENCRLIATNSNVTTTNASTVYIKGAPVASTNQTVTNAYALKIEAGSSYFGGNIELGHASDTTIARTAAGTVAIEGKEIITKNKVLNTNSYAYHYSGTDGHYIPMSGATTSDSTSLSVNSYHLHQIMPYDGRVVRIVVYNQSATSRTDKFEMYINGDDDDLTGDQRGTDLSFTSTRTGSGDCASDWTFSKEEGIAIRRTPSAALNGTTVTVVFEFDMTT